MSRASSGRSGRPSDSASASALAVVWQCACSRSATSRTGDPLSTSSAPRYAAGPSTRLGLPDFTGRWLVVTFHVADWDPVTESQLRSLSNVAVDLRERGIDVVSVSPDTVWSHLAFGRSAGIAVPLLADDDPPGAVALAYGTGPGRGARALFLIDPEQQIRWSQLVDRRLDPGVDGLLSAIDRLVAPAKG